MRSTVLWSLVLFSCIPSTRGDNPGLPVCGHTCLADAFQNVGCFDIQCICQRDPDLQKLLQCIFTKCNAVEYSPAIKVITGHCINTSITNTIQRHVSKHGTRTDAVINKPSTDTDKVVAHTLPIQLNLNLHLGQGDGIRASDGVSPAHIAEKMLSTNIPSGDLDGHQAPIEMNINLHYSDSQVGGTSTSTNPSKHIEKLLSGPGVSVDKTLHADCPPNAAGCRVPGPFVSSGSPSPPPPPPPPPAVVTVTQTVAAPPPPPTPPPPPPPSPALVAYPAVPLAAAPPAYNPPNTAAYFRVKAAGIEPLIATATNSFYTVTLTIPGVRQNNEVGDGVDAYGNPTLTGYGDRGGTLPIGGDPGYGGPGYGPGGGIGPATGSSVMTIPALPPSVWATVNPAQVTQARAAQISPSFAVLFSFVGLALLQILFLSS